ncbi:MAG TPA: AAA family ATPase, partial [Longimicrobiaceae bacterium]|nr:AAA family ATPase [Longimicrobiaceae bacterium]
MRVQKIQIEGFGPLVKREIGPFGPRVNVVVGPNEAGKSALRAFIRTVVMGFPRAGSIEDRAYGFPAVDGMAHGGSIEFLDAAGRPLFVERVRKARGPYTGVVRVVRDGQPGDAQVLASVLPYVGGRVYDNVFSLSLDELQGLDQDVQKRIYSAAFGSTGAVINDVRERLGREYTDLSKAMTEARRTLSEIIKAYAQARLELAHYGEIAAEAGKLEKDLAELRHAVAELRARRTHLELLQATRPAFDQMNELQRIMAELPRRSYMASPTRLKSEYEGLLARRSEAARELSQGDQDQELRLPRLEVLKGALAPLEYESQAERLLARKSEYQNAIRDREGVLGQLQKGREALLSALSDLGPEFDEARLAELDTSIASKERLDRHDRRLVETENAEREANARAAAAADRLKSAREALEEAEAKQKAVGEPVEESSDDLRARRARVEQLRALDLRAAQRQRELEDSQVKLRAVRQTHPVWARRIAYGQLALSTVLAVAGIATIILANGAADAAFVQTGIAMAGIGVAGFALAGGLILATRAGERPMENELADTDLTATLQSSIEALQSEVEGVEDEVLNLAADLGYGKPPAEWELADEASRLASDADRRADYDRFADQTALYRRQFEDAEAASKEADAAAAAAADAADRARRDWRKWLASMGLAADISPRAALAMISQADASRERMLALADLSARVDQMTRAIEEVEEGLQELAPALNLPRVEPGEATIVLARLDEALEGARSARSESARLEAESTNWTQRREQLTEERDAIEEQVGKLVRQIGADDEDDLARTIEGAMKHRELSEKLMSLRIASPGLSSPKSKEIIDEIRSTTPEAIERALAEVEGEILELEERQARLNSRTGELLNQQAALQAAGRTAELASAIAARREEARDVRERLAMRWLAMKLI